MPKRPPHPCNWPGCPALTNARYCQSHEQKARQRHDRDRGSAASRGYDARWRRIRALVLAEEPLCQDCLKENVIKPATDVDHVDGNVQNMSRENLRPLCHEHHSAKTVRENGAFGRPKGE